MTMDDMGDGSVHEFEVGWYFGCLSFFGCYGDENLASIGLVGFFTRPKNQS